MTLSEATQVDMFVVLACAGALLYWGRLALSHPATMYLAFHILVITTRANSLAGGSPALLGLTEAQAARALGLADIVLITLTASWIIPTPPSWDEPPKRSPMVRPTVVRVVAFFALPIGIYTDIRQGYTADSGLANHDFSTSYQVFAFTWPGLVLLAFIYLYGFRWYLTVPLVAFLAFEAVQGTSRYRLALPVILIAQIYLDRRGLRLPPLRVIAALVLVGLLFFRLDAIGTAFRTGHLSASTIGNAISDSYKSVTKGGTDDQQVFDQFAISMSLSDQYGRPQYGKHYLDLLTLPIPRPMWPNKPATNEDVKAISTGPQPLATIGAVLSFPGEFYTNFRTAGTILASFFTGRWLLFLYRRGRASGYGTVRHFLYLIIAAILIQVYRDGISSLVVFLFVHNAPFVLIAIFSTIRARGRDEVADRGEARVRIAATGPAVEVLRRD